MSNHGFIHLKDRIDGDRLWAEMQKINQARFKGKIEIKRGTYDKRKPLCWIELQEGVDIMFWLANPKKVEHRHGPGGDLRWWIESVFANDLGLALKGMHSGEGCGGKWKPKKKFWPTLRSMLDETWNNSARYEPESPAYKMMTEKERAEARLLDAYFIDKTIKDSRGTRPDLFVLQARMAKIPAIVARLPVLVLVFPMNN